MRNTSLAPRPKPGYVGCEKRGKNDVCGNKDMFRAAGALTTRRTVGDRRMVLEECMLGFDLEVGKFIGVICWRTEMLAEWDSSGCEMKRRKGM